MGAKGKARHYCRRYRELWKGKFNTCKSQTIYDTFYNMMSFAEEYDAEMDEDAMSELDDIGNCKLSQMQEDACYQTGVLGFGIVSNILNHIGLFFKYVVFGKNIQDIS